MKRSIYTIFAAFALAAACLAQANGNSVSGTVISEGSPASGATVELTSFRTGRELKTTTGTNGKFDFTGVASGRYVVSAQSASGDRLAVELIEIADQGMSIELHLSPVPPVREVVDVSVSSGTVQPVSDVSKSVNVIGGEELESRNDVSIVDALKTIPGFRVQQFGGFGSTANIKTRGLQEQGTSVLIDGLRFRDPAAITGDASPYLADLTVLGIDRIEVLRGSGSSVYGTNAIGGVVDLRTSEPRNGIHGDFESEVGGLGFKRLVAGLNGGSDRIAVGGSFARTVISEGIDGDDDLNNNGFLARVDFRPFRETSVGGRVFASNVTFDLNSNPEALGDVGGMGIVDAQEGVNFTADANDPDNVQESDLLGIQLRLEQALTPSLLFRASYQGLDTKRQTINGPLGPGFQPFGGDESSTFEGRIDTFAAKIDWYAAAGQTFTVGYEFEAEAYGNNGFGPAAGSDFTAESSQSSNTFYLQHLAGFFDSRLQLAGGFRTQLYSVGDPAFSVINPPYEDLSIADPPTSYTFDGAASWYFSSSRTKIRAHVGNGYRLPSLYERLGTFYSSFSQAFFALGDPRLEPERSISFDAGIEQTLADDKLSISATYFYTKMTDIIGFANVVPDIGSTPRPFGGYTNEEGGIARGAEIFLDAKPLRGTYVFASYTYTNSDQIVPEVAGSGIISTLGIPEHQFTFVAAQQIGKRLTVSFDAIVTDDYLAPIFSNIDFTSIIYRFDGSRRGDLSGVYTIPLFGERASLKIKGTLQNVFDSEYFENGFRTEGRTGRIGVGVEF
ncbi:MAG: TonB-dependent receptor [Acidobacteria bacterium]|nr:MAG: TonB-dependent receptor [Acidobacteriota bacterium]REK02435.1 MAG: TonB-dependent receptor [Acidobacteriota bacterium]REK13764.1 MAG: TonB-dependent receptor [Acidobacteriota bacterium]REK41758.1 MAG: TonB-dependent receptor [Acidobacteriota bacterium]